MINLKAAYPEHWELLSKKGIYCYDYMNSMERFDETSLPSKEHFLTSFNMISMYRTSGISMLKCNTLNVHYLITDILLLAAVFENFRKMETYGLDPIHYYSLPGNGVELKLITEPDMHQMVQKSMTFVIDMLPRIIPTWICMRMKRLGS